MEQTTKSNEEVKKEPIELKPTNTGTSISEKDLSVLAHLSALLGFLFPFLAIAGPLVIYLFSADKPEAQKHAKAAVNFNITFTIAFLVSALLMFVAIGFLLLPIVGIIWLVCIIMAAIKTGEGKEFKYPATIEFLK